MGPKYKVVGSGNQAGIALDVNITTDFLSVVRLMAESIAEQYPCDHDCSETGDTSSKDSLECLRETASQFKDHDMLYRIEDTARGDSFDLSDAIADNSPDECDWIPHYTEKQLYEIAEERVREIFPKLGKANRSKA